MNVYAMDPFAILTFPLGRSLHWSNIAIGSDPDMILAANLNRVFDVTNDIDRHWLRIHTEALCPSITKLRLYGGQCSVARSAKRPGEIIAPAAARLLLIRNSRRSSM